MNTARTHRHPRAMYRVCWMSVVGRGGGRGQPLPRNVAEFVARDEALANPLRRYWVEECRPDEFRASASV